MKRGYVVYRTGPGSGSGTACKSLTEAMDLARYLLKQGIAVTIEPA